jgi:hypothetical protein
MHRVLAVALALLASSAGAQFAPAGYHPGNVAYYNAPYFANALLAGGEWRSFTGFEFGTLIDANTAQFADGYPQYLEPGQKLRATLFGLNIHNPFRPAAWPRRDTLAKGRIVVTWNGTADIRLVSGTFVAAQSTVAATGSFANGRRVYDCLGENESTQTLEVHAIGATPPSQIRVWLAGLEGQLFHPLLLQRVADRNWAFIRFMDWGATNASPVMDWADRRRPAHIFQTGILNRRSPALDDQLAEGNRETGVSYEHMVALCNATGKDLWINIPHLATADFMTKLAKLIRFGSDGVNPYDSAQASPVHPPLDPARKVYVEYSNEIWSSGFAFPQGNWAEAQGTATGLGKARFNGRKFCDTWRAFQDVFGGTDRLVRVAATFTANETYTAAFLDEIADYGPALTPAVAPDVLAVTTYFGNGIQDFVSQQGFTAGRQSGDPYWTSPLFATHVTRAFDEWKRRMMAGDAVQGAGPDATGIGGGFSASLRAYGLPIVAYEGGPSLFTDHIDSGGSNSDDGVTTFVEAMNRDPRIADLYRIHLEIARSKGLRTHTPYTDTSPWSRFGQWGHLETLDATPASSPKYALMLEHFDTYTSTLRHIDTPQGAVPQFATSAILPPAIAGQPYTADIATSGGDGTRTATIISAYLEPGLSIAAGPAAGTLRISGVPTASGKNFVLARVHDADGDPAWRVFTLETFGGLGVLVQSDFRGTSPALHRPWTATYVLSPEVTWSGWTLGTGVVAAAGDHAFVFSQNGYLTATVTPAQGPIDLRGGEIRFSIRRIDFHAPLTYALQFDGATLSTSPTVEKDNFDETEHVVAIPSTAQFAAVHAPFELRIAASGAEFDGHRTSLTGFRIAQSAALSITAPANLVATASSSTQIALTWSPVAGTTYEVFRDGAALSTSALPSFTDGVSAGSAHLYRVRALAPGATSAFSNTDLATAIAFTGGPVIQRAHVAELRTAADAVRALAALPGGTYLPITPFVTPIRAADITDLRAALTPALTALGLPVPPFTAGATAGAAVRAVHVEELRNAVR